MKLGDPELLDGWRDGRTVVIGDAGVITMSEDIGDVVGDVVLAGDRIVAVGPGAGTQVPDDALRIDASVRW